MRGWRPLRRSSARAIRRRGRAAPDAAARGSGPATRRRSTNSWCRTPAGRPRWPPRASSTPASGAWPMTSPVAGLTDAKTSVGADQPTVDQQPPVGVRLGPAVRPLRRWAVTHGGRRGVLRWHSGLLDTWIISFSSRANLTFREREFNQTQETRLPCSEGLHAPRIHSVSAGRMGFLGRLASGCQCESKVLIIGREILCA